MTNHEGKQHEQQKQHEKQKSLDKYHGMSASERLDNAKQNKTEKEARGGPQEHKKKEQGDKETFRRHGGFINRELFGEMMQKEKEKGNKKEPTKEQIQARERWHQLLGTDKRQPQSTETQRDNQTSKPGTERQVESKPTSDQNRGTSTGERHDNLARNKAKSDTQGKKDISGQSEKPRTAEQPASMAGERLDNPTQSKHVTDAQDQKNAALSIPNVISSARSDQIGRTALNPQQEMREKSEAQSGNTSDQVPTNAQIGNRTDQTVLSKQQEQEIDPRKAEINPSISDPKLETPASLLKDYAHAPEAPAREEVSFGQGLFNVALERVSSKMVEKATEVVVGAEAALFVSSILPLAEVAKAQIEFIVKLGEANETGTKEECRNVYIGEYVGAVAHLTEANPSHWTETYKKEQPYNLKGLLKEIPPVSLDRGGHIQALNAIASTAHREALRAVIHLGEKGTQEFRNRYPDYEARRQAILKEFYSVEH